MSHEQFMAAQCSRGAKYFSLTALDQARLGDPLGRARYWIDMSLAELRQAKEWRELHREKTHG